MSQDMTTASMQIILHAGDARLECKKALDAITYADFGKAEKCLKQAQAEITTAHKWQTDAIQEEMRGEDFEYSLLFIHAQDTLMTIYSEINIAKQLYKILFAYDQRISTIEDKHNIK